MYDAKNKTIANSYFALCKPIEIDGVNHIVGVSKWEKDGKHFIEITHNTRTIDGNKEIPGTKSVVFDKKFIPDVIKLLNIYLNQ